MARTDTLPHFLTDVADAIREKAGTSETIQASDFDTEIKNLPSGGGANLDEYFYTEITNDTSVSDNMSKKVIKKLADVIVSDNVTNLSYAYYSSKETHLPKLIFNNNITNTQAMYSNCLNLINLDCTGMNTSNVTNMKEMFFASNGSADLNLADITFSNKFTGNNVDNTSSMFHGRRGLTNLDLSAFNTPKLKNCTKMFYDCRKLTFLDIRQMTFDTVTSSTNMFYNSMPNDCLIIVKSDTEKDWITSKFTFLTNVKTVAEYEAEQSE